MPHDVFISHSTDDKLVALALCNKLETAGVRCWIAPRDVNPGAEWGKSIVDAIRECRIMVLIFSSKANNSRHIHREVQTAFEQDLTVIPFRVENTQPTGTMEYYLGSVHWLDALTAPVESHMMGLVDRVKALLPAAKSEPIAEAAPPIPQPVPPIVTHSESTQSQRAENPPELKKASDVPPPYVAPVSGTSGPAASPPLSHAASSPRKKMIQRILTGVVGVIAILYGARQVANGLHLFSSTSSSTSTSTAPSKSHAETMQEINKTLASLELSRSPASVAPSAPAPLADDLEGAFTQGCYIQYPKGWEKKETSPVSVMFIAPKSSGLSANMIVTTDQFAGTLRQYVEATMTAIKASSPAVRVVSDLGFTSSLETKGYKVTIRNKIKDVEFAQALYFFVNKAGTKVVITSSASSAQAAKLDPLFDRCVAQSALY